MALNDSLDVVWLRLVTSSTPRGSMSCAHEVDKSLVIFTLRGVCMHVRGFRNVGSLRPAIIL